MRLSAACGVAVLISLRPIIDLPRLRVWTAEIHGGLALRASSVRDMKGLVLRVRLISGDSMDVSYDDRNAGSEGEVLNHVVNTLSQDSGVLRCQHGEWPWCCTQGVVAAVEVAPRGAVLERPRPLAKGERHTDSSQ